MKLFARGLSAKRLLSLTLTMILMVGALVVPAYASPGKPDVGLYHDFHHFKAAVAATRANRWSVPPMSGAEKEARRQAISDAVDAALLARQDLGKVAAQYELVIYQPEAVPNGDISPLYSDSSAVAMPVTSIIWDYRLSEWDYSGSMQWKDANQIKSDFDTFGTAGSVVGGQDAIGLEFSNVTNPGQILSWRAAAYDATGTTTWTSTVPGWAPRSGSKYAVVFAGQDFELSDPATYSWWGVVMHVWFSSYFGDHGYVYTTYAHDYKGTSLSSVDFGVAGSTDATVTGGLTFHFSSANYRWTGISLSANY